MMHRKEKYKYLRARNRVYEADFHARYTGVRLNGDKSQVPGVSGHSVDGNQKSGKLTS